MKRLWYKVWKYRWDRAQLRIAGLSHTLFPYDELEDDGFEWDWPELPAICRYPDEIHREMIRVKSQVRHYIEDLPFISLTNSRVAHDLVFNARLERPIKNIHVVATVEL